MSVLHYYILILYWGEVGTRLDIINDMDIVKMLLLQAIEGEGIMKHKIGVIFLAGIFLIAVAARGYAEESKLDMKKIAKNIMEAMNSGDYVVMANIYAPDAVMITPDQPEPVLGREAFLKYYQTTLRAVPDLKFEATSTLFSGDTIICEFLVSGTFTGPMATPEGDVAPTGNSVKMRSVTLFKIGPDGLIAEDRTYYDTFTQMQQLGLLQ